MIKFTNKKLKKGKLIISLVTLVLALTICIPFVRNTIFADNNTIDIDGTIYDLDNLDQYKTGTPQTGAIYGITYSIYPDTGLCVLEGNQDTDNIRFEDIPWNNANEDVKIIYANYNANGHSQEEMFRTSAWTVAFVTGPNFDTSDVTNMSGMFQECKGLKKIDLSQFDTSSVADMSYMFYDCEELKQIDLSSIKFSSLEDASYMFYWCYELENVKFPSTIDVSELEDMSFMFHECTNLKSLDLSNFNTESLDNMYYMFYGCSSLTSINFKNFDTSNVTSMNTLFANCSSLTNLDLSSFDTSNVEYMCSMFYGCENLTTLNISSFDTQNVTDMSAMFMECKSIKVLDLSNFDTSDVEDMNSMFYECESLTTLNISSFNTHNVTDMNAMFMECKNLTELNLSNFDTQNVIDMSHMFTDCNKLTELDLSNLNTSNVTDMNYMFCGLKNLTAIDVSNFDTTYVEYMNSMFSECSSLKEIDISNFDMTYVTQYTAIFDNCRDLETIYLPYIDPNQTDVLFYYTTYWNDGYPESRYLYGLARHCPNLKTIVIYSSFEGFGKIDKYEEECDFEKYGDYNSHDVTAERFNKDNYEPGGLFYTEKVNGNKVPLDIVVVGDYTGNEAIEKLGTEDDPFYSLYEEDNRIINVKVADTVTFGFLDNENLNTIDTTTPQPFDMPIINGKVKLPGCPWYYLDYIVFTGWAKEDGTLITGDTLYNATNGMKVYAKFEEPKVLEYPTYSNGYLLKMNYSPLWDILDMGYEAPVTLLGQEGKIDSDSIVYPYYGAGIDYKYEAGVIFAMDSIFSFYGKIKEGEKIKVSIKTGLDDIEWLEIGESNEDSGTLTTTKYNNGDPEFKDEIIYEVKNDCDFVQIAHRIYPGINNHVTLRIDPLSNEVPLHIVLVDETTQNYVKGNIDMSSLPDGTYHLDAGCGIYKYLGSFELKHTSGGNGGSSHKKKTKEVKEEEPKEDKKIEIQMYIGKNEALVNGTKKYLDTAPFIEDDRTFLPVRFISENLKANVSWDKVLRKVTVTNNDTTIILTIGSDIALVNDKEIKLDTKAFIKDDRTFIPIRFVSENLGCNVTFEKEQKEVSIKEKDNK
ncbi:MAG: BspA family leucine-rich repeat surface protein [Clostridia bacterium]|nr:BspA family leucine-rich repeat surface protein [Clostridia bacterium]